MAVANCTLPSIDPNPDVSGIGVRTAIYAQAILTLVQPVLAALDKFISEEELASLHMLYLGILMPGCALLLSAVIQTSKYGLSVYHATIVLNLSWINNTSALIFFQFALIAEMKLKDGREFRGKVGELLSLLTKSLDPGQGSSPEAVRRAAERAGRLRFALRTALEKHEKWNQERERLKGVGNRDELRDHDKTRIKAEVDGSRDILRDVIQGLTELRVAAESNDGGKERGHAVTTMRKRLEDARFGRALGLKKPPQKQSAGRLSGSWKALKRWMQNQVYRMPGGMDLWYLLERDFAMATVTVLHLTFFSAYGAWFWFTIAHRPDYCEQLTTHSIIFVSIPVTSKALRIITIIFYIICTIPFVNVLIFGSLELIVIYRFYLAQRWLRARFTERPNGPGGDEENPQVSGPNPQVSGPPNVREFLGKPSDRTSLYSFIALTLVLQVYFIVSNELTIRYNAHLLNTEGQGVNEENEWTFGQTLAIALIVVPLVQVWTDARKPENWEVLTGWLKRSQRTE